ncbi:MAG: hypothetical protein ABIJ61_06900 [bacterium]
MKEGSDRPSNALGGLIRRIAASLRAAWRDPLKRRYMIVSIVGFTVAVITSFIYAYLRHRGLCG